MTEPYRGPWTRAQQARVLGMLEIAPGEIPPRTTMCIVVALTPASFDATWDRIARIEDTSDEDLARQVADLTERLRLSLDRRGPRARR